MQVSTAAGNAIINKNAPDWVRFLRRVYVSIAAGAVTAVRRVYVSIAAGAVTAVRRVYVSTAAGNAID